VSVELVLKQRDRLDAILSRLKQKIGRAMVDPMVTKENLLEMVNRFESHLMNLIIIIEGTSTSRRSTALIPMVLEAEKMLRTDLLALRSAINDNRLTDAYKLVDNVRTSFFSLLRTALYVFPRGAGRGAETAPEHIAGIKMPEEMSMNAFRVYTYLKQKPEMEADLETLMKVLGMPEDVLLDAIEELKDLDYIDILSRGRSIIIRLKEV